MLASLCRGFIFVFIVEGLILSSLFARSLAVSSVHGTGDIISVTINLGWREKNRHYMAVEFYLGEGWKTYWRLPYDTGLPTKLYIHSTDLEIDEIFWPKPEILTQNGFTIIGYQKYFALPFAVKTNLQKEDIPIKATVHMGVCFQVCVPIQIDFEHLLPSQKKPSQKILKMMQNIPERITNKAQCNIGFDGSEMILTAHLPLVAVKKNTFVFVDIIGSDIFFEQIEPKYYDDGLFVEAVLNTKERLKNRDIFANLRFTIIDDRHALEIVGCE